MCRFDHRLLGKVETVLGSKLGARFKKESVKFPLHILLSIFKTNFISKANNCVISMHNTLLKYVTTSQSENVSNNLIG